jgi:hypothetical protein
MLWIGENYVDWVGKWVYLVALVLTVHERGYGKIGALKIYKPSYNEV